MKHKQPDRKPGIYLTRTSRQVAMKLKQWYGDRAHVVPVSCTRFTVAFLYEEFGDDMSIVDCSIDRLVGNTTGYPQFEC